MVAGFQDFRRDVAINVSCRIPLYVADEIVYAFIV